MKEKSLSHKYLRLTLELEVKVETMEKNPFQLTLKHVFLYILFLSVMLRVPFSLKHFLELLLIDSVLLLRHRWSEVVDYYAPQPRRMIRLLFAHELMDQPRFATNSW